MRPSKPSSRRVSAALAPARPAPTITNVFWSDTASSGQGQELLARARVVAHEPVQGGRDGARAGLLHAPQRHAHVLGLDDDADALRLEVVVQPPRHLRGQPLLDLQVAGEELDDA